MEHSECMDRVKFTLSDDSGTLRFASFDIKQSGCCEEALNEIRTYLLSRPLDELDMDELKNMSCPTGNLICLQSLANAVAEYQTIFCETNRRKEPSRTAV